VATQIIINFLTKNLDKAKQTAKEIAAKMKEARKAITDPTVRKAFVAKQKEIARERKDEIAGGQRRIGLEDRAGALAGRDLVGQGLGNAGKQGLGALKKLGAVANVASSANLAGALSMLGGVPIVGQVAVFAAAAAAIVLPIMEKRQAFLDAVRADSIRAQIRSELSREDFVARLANDVQFRALQERRAADLFLRTERSRAVGGWHPRSGGLIEVG